jgi:hypothetical protein
MSKTARPIIATFHDPGGWVGTFNVQRSTFNFNVLGVARPLKAPSPDQEGRVETSRVQLSTFDF